MAASFGLKVSSVLVQDEGPMDLGIFSRILSNALGDT